MNNIIKFPKGKAQVINKIYEAYDDEKYNVVCSFKDELIESVDLFKDTDVLDILLESYFELFLFEEVVMVADELLKKGYESFSMLYLALLSNIALVDIYQAKSLIKRSKILNDESIKPFFLKEGANYSNILSLRSDVFYEASLCLLIVNFVNEVSTEMLGEIEVDKEYLLYRFFDLINMVYELGYDISIIKELEHVLRIVFQIEV